MSAEAAVEDAWEREPATGRHFTQREGGSRFELPERDTKDHAVFIASYAQKFSGDNHEEALRFAQFCVFYRKGMGLPPYDTRE